ncbi:rhodanese-like domain-containing protein [Niveispirillum irakense]|uniref:rhodanese-like domain-containing protein n=1 Tax=Niveispirillum irakense TaxID=34011 RepID=UPI000420A92D|nr:rhodanese-like domain-containing protein [Niveispirillum irakense]
MDIQVEDLAVRVEQGDITLLDVREGWEVELCAIDGSLHIPLGQLLASVSSLPRDRDLAVLCHHGMRSAHATAWLRAQGFDRAVNIAGGIDAWARRIDPSMKVY